MDRGTDNTRVLEMRCLSRDPASNLVCSQDKGRNNKIAKEHAGLGPGSAYSRASKDQIVVIVVMAMRLCNHASAVSVQKVNKSHMDRVRR